jgi:predicted metalloprotease with PDZ domain
VVPNIITNDRISNPDELSGTTDYYKGSLVLAAVDREIRRATAGSRTLQDVFRRINRESDPTLETLLETIREVSNAEVAATAEQYITTSATPEYRPSDSQLETLYGYESRQIERELVSFSAVGEAWRRSLESGPKLMGLSEQLQIGIRVRNTGNATGTVAVAPRMSTREGELERIEGAWIGRVPPGETVTRVVTQDFEQAGTYDFAGAAQSSYRGARP